MLTFLKYLIQLILSPRHGWEDLESSVADGDALLRTGLYPLLGIAAATEMLALLYGHGASLPQVLIAATGDFAAYFAAIFIARMLFDLYFTRLCGVEAEQERVNTFITAGIGLMVFFRIVANCLPWNLVILKFLPVYVILVLTKGMPFLSVPKRADMRFLALASLAIVAVPLIIYYLFSAII